MFLSLLTVILFLLPTVLFSSSSIAHTERSAEIITRLQQTIERLTTESHQKQQQIQSLETNITILTSQHQRTELHYQQQLSLKSNEIQSLYTQLKKQQQEVNRYISYTLHQACVFVVSLSV